ARSMAEAWGVEVEFVQVTRQTALDLLLNGSVDFLAAAQVHHRSLDSKVEFSQTYYRGGQALMVRNDDGAAVPAHMDGRKIGYVIGTPAAEAVSAWQTRTGINLTITEYLTIDQGLTALVAGEIDGLVGSIIQLRAILQPGVVKIVDEWVMDEPYAIAVRRQDIGLRNLVNRTLQHLAQNGRLNEIYQSNFPGSTYPPGLIPTWENLGEDAPKPDQFTGEITFPQQYVIPRIQGGQTIRVAGLPNPPAEDAVESERRLYALNRGLVEALIGRWGAAAEFIPDSAANALDLVASGQADLAVGVRPDWSWADRVDFTSTYFLHGDRLMVEKSSNVESFNELRGGFWVGIFASEPGSADQVNQLAESVNTAVNIYTMIREQDVPIYILEEENADVAFGDSLKLIPHVQARPDDFRMAIRCPNCDPWYTREYVAFAVPRNDIDFRLLVEYTLQELERDGTLNTLLQLVMLPEDQWQFDVWPGASSYLGITLFKREG
ncbi:MAG: transporter substrate-binding domain-containing protein, partial [Anaerolineae bacterium]|nr:transporter substrate-binding domain-containing protein [Anaerolineae bacterium]